MSFCWTQPDCTKVRKVQSRPHTTRSNSGERLGEMLHKGYVLLTIAGGCIISITKRTGFWQQIGNKLSGIVLHLVTAYVRNSVFDINELIPC